MKLNLIFLYNFNVLIYTMTLQGEKKDGSDSLFFFCLTDLLDDRCNLSFALLNYVAWLMFRRTHFEKYCSTEFYKLMRFFFL